MDTYALTRRMEKLKRWFLIKTNWPTIIESEKNLLNRNYIGLGGNIWPVDGLLDEQSIEIQKNIEGSRDYIDINSNTSIFVVQNKILALKYKEHASTSGLDIILIEVSIADETTQADGYDFGNPEGGYSIIESAILAKDNRAYVDKYLNPTTGLFNNFSDIQKFISQAEETEELDSYLPVGVRHIN